MQNMNLKRLTAWIAMVAVIFVMLFSAIYISEHLEHECTGEDCPVCAEIVQCVNNMKTMGSMVAVVIATFFLCRSIQTGMQYAIAVCFGCSLISLKVRMNN